MYTHMLFIMLIKVEKIRKLNIFLKIKINLCIEE